MPSLTVLLTTTGIGILAIPLLAVAGLGDGTTPACVTSTVTSTSTPRSPAANPPTTTTDGVREDWDGEQRRNAEIIVTVGNTNHVPAGGWVLAVATAIDLSGLHNRPTGKNGAIGVFQQHPSAEWGTRVQLTSPAYQAGKFYEALMATSDQRPLPQTDQAVWRVGLTTVQARHTRDAIALVVQIAADHGIALPENFPRSTGSDGCSMDDSDGITITGISTLPAGFAIPAGTPEPVVAAISWALQQLGGAYSYGGDCSDPHGTSAAHECDCSSLTQVAYRHGGISLPRTTSQQVHSGTPVADLTQLQPGDLVFIPGSKGTAAAPKHVGMYIGDGLILNAPHTGAVIRLNSLRQWSAEIATVRRIIPS